MGIYEHAQKVKKAAKGGVALGSDIQKEYRKDKITQTTQTSSGKVTSQLVYDKSGTILLKQDVNKGEVTETTVAATGKPVRQNVRYYLTGDQENYLEKSIPYGADPAKHAPNIPIYHTTTATQKVTYYSGTTKLFTKTIPYGADPVKYAPNIPVIITSTEYQATGQQRKQIKDFRAAGGTFKYEQVPKNETGGLNIISKTKPVEPEREIQKTEGWWRTNVEQKVTESKSYKATFGKIATEMITHLKEKAPDQVSFMSVIDRPGKKYLDKPFDIKIASGEKVYSKLRSKQEASSEFIRGSEVGYIEFKRDYPVASAALYIGGAIAPEVIGGVAGSVSSKLTPVIGPSATKAVGVGVQTALLTGTTYLTAKEIQSGEGAFGKGQKAGKIIAIAEPIIVGGLVGSEVVPKIQSKIRTIGREEIPTEKVVPKDVLSGKSRFYEAPKSQHAELFAKSGKMYHATGTDLGKEIIVQKGSSEIEGLYGAPKVSPHFLRTGHGEIGIGEWQPGQQPTVLKITPKGFQVNPGASTIPRKLGVADIPLIKTEVEAVLPPGTPLVKTAGQSFFKYQGYNVPINEYEVAGSKFLPNIKSLFSGISGLGSTSSSALPITSKVSPSSVSSLLSAGIAGIGISTSSRGSSKFRFVRPSYAISSKVSSIISSPVSPSPPSPVITPITSTPSSGGRGGASLSVLSIPSSTTGTSISPPPIFPTITAKILSKNLDAGDIIKAGRSKKKVKQPKSYKPTLTTATLNIRGRSTKIGISSGLGIRPIRL